MLDIHKNTNKIRTIRLITWRGQDHSFVHFTAEIENIVENPLGCY